MSCNFNMVLFKQFLRSPVHFQKLSNSFSSCAVLSLSNSMFSKNLITKHFILLSKAVHLKKAMSSLGAISEIETSTDSTPAPKLTKETANALVFKLTSDERTTLLSTLQQFESEQLKAEYRGHLAAFRWRTKLGRPSKVPRLGDVDPTGSYCPVPENWLAKKYAETVPIPTGPQLFAVGVHNAVPFIGFGFLDNFLMIICGDYIELTLGSFMTLSTMAAAALGNTFSDVLGLGCAGYVETLAAKVGVKAPQLSPVQLDMKSSRMFANFGRGIGVTIGCILGMTPLLFMKNKEAEKKGKEISASNEGS